MRFRPAARRSLLSRRTLLAGGLILPFGVAACGAGSGDPAAGDPAAGTGHRRNPAEPGAFPVTIEHKFGRTTIESTPSRIVTVGLVEQDALLALGVVPLATTKWLGEYAGAIGPWARPKLGDAPVPKLLTDVDGVQFERVAQFEPDLILGLYSGLGRDDYQTLSAIAPTVAQPATYPDYGISWQDLTRTVGRSIGRPDHAARLVREVEDRFLQVRRQHPEFSGATALVATPYEGYFVYGPTDPRSRLLASLGFRLPAGLGEAVGDAFGANISLERADLLDTDVIVWIVDDAKAGPAKLHAEKLYGALDVVAERREIFVEDSTDYGNATSFISVLSLPYLLDGLTSRLAAAVDDDPATVPEPLK